MKRFIALFAMAFTMTPTPTHADVTWPPAHYDYPYTGKLEVIETLGGTNYLGETFAYANCDVFSRLYGWGSFPAEMKETVVGCSIGGRHPESKDPEHCIIIVSPMPTPEASLRLFRHEMAHCNGWRHD